jgi:hypothetical protein
MDQSNNNDEEDTMTCEVTENNVKCTNRVIFNGKNQCSMCPPSTTCSYHIQVCALHRKDNIKCKILYCYNCYIYWTTCQRCTVRYCAGYMMKCSKCLKILCDRCTDKYTYQKYDTIFIFNNNKKTVLSKKKSEKSKIICYDCKLLLQYKYEK